MSSRSNHLLGEMQSDSEVIESLSGKMIEDWMASLIHSALGKGTDGWQHISETEGVVIERRVEEAGSDEGLTLRGRTYLVEEAEEVFNRLKRGGSCDGLFQVTYVLSECTLALTLTPSLTT